MQSIELQLAAAVAERDRIEAEVWARALEAPYPSEREQVLPYLPALQELLTRTQKARWRVLGVAIEELEKFRA